MVEYSGGAHRGRILSLMGRLRLRGGLGSAYIGLQSGRRHLGY